ncbi:MAG: hypothetical protein ACK5Q5_14725 [Planctomycetaceae bacterium]
MPIAQLQRLPVRVLIARLVFALSLTTSGVCFFSARQDWNAASRAETARPMSIRVDLSQPGVTSTTFQQTYGNACNQLLLLPRNAVFDGDADPQLLLSGLTGSVRLLDNAGQLLGEYRLDADHARYDHAGNLLLSHFDFPKLGAFEAQVHLTSGAAALSDHPQQLESRYQLCGLEYFPACAYGGSGAAALLVAIAAWPFTRRHSTTTNDSPP